MWAHHVTPHHFQFDSVSPITGLVYLCSTHERKFKQNQAVRSGQGRWANAEAAFTSAQQPRLCMQTIRAL